MRYIYFGALFILAQSVSGLSALAVEQLLRAVPENKKTSLIIPCYHKHAPKLYALLRMYEEQTKLPDEVVISLSEVHLVEQHVLDELRAEQWAFPVKLLVTEEKKYAGENRNIACSHATGDIFICQDADDIPHTQRIEIIHYFFATYAIDHLMHLFVLLPFDLKENPFVKYADFGKLPCVRTRDFNSIWRQGIFTNGNVAITRELFEIIKWPDTPRGQDTEFNKTVYRHTNRCLAVEAVLYGYRQYLSSVAKSAAEVEVVTKVVYTR